ncbi:MAG: tyrosine--tRNA ligase [Minisyncoccia bacterium]
MTVEEIDDLLTRGVATFVDPRGQFKEKLLKNPSEVIIKFGIDPTRPDIHLGHAVILQKLRKFQNLGCKVVFLVGDFTARIGDPTGKSKVRPEIEQKEIEENMQTYLVQVGKILSTESKVFSWIRNSDWFYSISDLAPKENAANIQCEGREYPPISFVAKAVHYTDTRMQLQLNDKNYAESFSIFNLLWILKHITYAHLVERDMFQERIKNGQPLHMNEMIYPVLQGVDSEIIYKFYGACDLEIGGTDQTFNMLMGRDVMKAHKQLPEQAVMSIDILVGTDGKEKMSKSLDNYIGITDEPQNMFGKVMSIPDTAIANYYKLCTTAEPNRIEDVGKKLKDSNVNPRDVKLDLAEEIVSMYHGRENAIAAREAFLSTFQKKEIPEDIVEIKREGKMGELLKSKEVVSSITEWRRLVDEGAVKRLIEDGKEEKITDFTVEATPGVYKIGKRRFVKII